MKIMVAILLLPRKWIYAPPENRPVWTGECNGVTIEALVIDDEEIIEKCAGLTW